MKPQMTVSYAGRSAAWGTDAAPRRAAEPCRPLPRSHRTTRAQLHLSHGIVFSEDRQGLRPAHFRMQRQQRGCGTLPVGMLFRLYRPAAQRSSRCSRLLDRRARPCRALQIDVDAVQISAAMSMVCCARTSRRPIAAPPCASSRWCMTAPAPWLPRWGNSCALRSSRLWVLMPRNAGKSSGSVRMRSSPR